MDARSGREAPLVARGEEHGGKVRCRLRVEGRVQGVGFRAWTVWRGRELGLRGWVRNLPDGSVELEAEGEAEAMGRLRHEVRHGPPLAAVRSVTELEPSTGHLSQPFEMR
jgi:acylphosphatase